MSDRQGLLAEDLWKSFRSGEHEVEVLRGVGLRMLPGESLAIVGPSGSGKSTLLHLVGGLDRPTRGRVSLDGVCPHELGDAELAAYRNRRVGFVFQDHHLLPQFDVLQNVLLPTVALGRGEPDREERARELLEAVGLGHRLGHRPAELSGGERQRVAIARALINRPALLLCDEPTGNLDARTAESVADLLFDLHTRAGNILIAVTHSLDLAGRFPSRAELTEGRLEEKA